MKFPRRPLPPRNMADVDLMGAFVPAPEITDWLLAAFCDTTSPLYDAEHDHLTQAKIGCMWTSVENVTKMVAVAARVELPKPHPALGKWGKARHEFQMREWFGDAKLDFLITFYAPYAAECSDLHWCALVKHELCHCAQALDDFGFPKFRKTDGRPVFAIKDHDVSEFVSVVRDFGPVGRNVREMAEAAKAPPRIGLAGVARVCGTCITKAA